MSAYVVNYTTVHLKDVCIYVDFVPAPKLASARKLSNNAHHNYPSGEIGVKKIS
jgi:hypothetical protein